MTLSQTDRLIRIATPLGDDVFIVLSFRGTEKISGLFRFYIELASPRGDIQFSELAAKNITVGIRSGNAERFFNGIITSFEPAGISEIEGYSKYRAVMAPALWNLTLCGDCRIFQDKAVDEILNDVLGDASLKAKQVPGGIEYRLELSAGYAPREYCVQYNETDYDFISRLCEQEGIFFHFEQQNGRHILVFGDAPSNHKPYAAGEKKTVRFQKTTGAFLDDEVITRLEPTEKLATGKYAARDYNFTIPDNRLDVSCLTDQEQTKTLGEIYEYPGGYDKSAGRGDTLAGVRIQAQDAQIFSIRGQSNCRNFVPGFRFTLAEYVIDDMNGKDYLLTSVFHEARQGLHSNTADGDHYTNEFSGMPHSVPYRPLRQTKRRLIVSSQTAVVTGPKGEEIHTDKHGRVKVKFHWDRRSDTNGDGNMSCWIRVSQNWAGGKWGAMHIPRVGQEVIVNFLDGDPDRPIITGRVYHGKNLPPYDLPTEKTKSTIMSSSSKGGGNSNEIRFEDKKGAEEVFTHAARNQNEIVENDMSTEVKNNQLIKVEQNRTITVSSGNEVLTVKSGARDVAVKSNEKHTNSADFKHSVSGNYTLKVNGNITIDATGLVKISGAKLILNG